MTEAPVLTKRFEECNKKIDSLRGSDPCSFFGQTDVLVEENQGFTAAFDQLTSELLSGHHNVLDHVKGLWEQQTVESRCSSKDMASASVFERNP